MQYVVDTTNEVVDSVDLVGIPTVVDNFSGKISVYPNPVVGDAHMTLTSNMAGNAVMRIYDLNGRVVRVNKLGNVSSGEHHFTVSTEGLSKGMYLINVIIGGHTAVAKMMVR